MAGQITEVVAGRRLGRPRPDDLRDPALTSAEVAQQLVDVPARAGRHCAVMSASLIEDVGSSVWVTISALAIMIHVGWR
ncbi:hypothetical protein ACQPZP_18720 [Spirillospora sp. CA-142024]|uniref:hypothetical protein n=1 Tax=Spirillospora sp. CA-142024 TaxID=3240036 RepID=UPI003D8D5A37